MVSDMLSHIRYLKTSQDESGCAIAATAIWALCAEDPKQRDAVRVDGGIEALLSVATKGSDGKRGGGRNAAMRALTLVAAHSEVNKTCIAEMGGIEVFVGALEDDLTSSKVKAASANGLCVLARNSANKTLITQAGGLEALLRLTETAKSRESLRFAAAALRNLSSGNQWNKMALATARAARSLVRLVATAVADKDNAVAEESAATVANAARTADDTNRLRLGEAGVIGPLVNLVSSDEFSSSCRAQAAGALAVLVCASANKGKLSVAGGIEPLTRLVVSGPASCKHEATCALRNLTAAKLADGDESHQAARDTAAIVRVLRGIPALVELLALGAEPVRASAAATLRNLTVIYKDAAIGVVEAGGARVLARVLVLDSSPTRATIEALGLLRNLAFDPRCRGAVGEEGIISMLLTMVKRNPPDACGQLRELVELALATLANLLAKHRANQLAFERAQGSSALLHLLKSNDLTPLERQHALGALKNLRDNTGPDSTVSSAAGTISAKIRRRAPPNEPAALCPYADSGPDGDGVSSASRRSTVDDICSIADDASSEWSATNELSEEAKPARIYIDGHATSC
mmetsp:Transcript_8355/g.25936  ORF Transcript_8355/g.25936 Transcript_8355/m.25936 type:complete len:578 (+) Transcript_8355:43-1776(+)